ncbi:MAG: ATP-binding protein [Erythrobacter sp.]
MDTSKRLPFAQSLLGQVMLVVAIGLFLGQAISAILLYQAAEQRRETAVVNAIAFRLVAMEEREERIERRMERRDELRGDRTRNRGGNLLGPPRRSGDSDNEREIRRFGLERSDEFQLQTNEQRDAELEESIATVLGEQLFEFEQIIVTKRLAGQDRFVVERAKTRPRLRQPGWQKRQIFVVGVQLPDAQGWRIVRLPEPLRPSAFARPVIIQTLMTFFILFGLLYLVLRRITRPLAHLTTRVDAFALNPDKAVALDPSGPRDIRQLMAAHNAMEARIAAMLDEKDVMLGAIGHDLKTPLAALRVRIESVSDDRQRARMAESIEDITNTLDDILSLARIGRTSTEPERANLTALSEAVVDEFDDLGEPVELVEASRIVARVHVTWVKRALRNLISNAVRYGQNARISLTEEGGDAVIAIEDNGPGIPDDQIAAMLEPFARGEASRNRATGGAGLGLTLARAIAEQHGGMLKLSNLEVGGLRAELRFPLAGIEASA